MKTCAVVLDEPSRLGVREVGLTAPTPADVIVNVEYSGISTGTERLLYTGRMPAFPGMGYPLVPGYESVGIVHSVGTDAQATSALRPGQRVFVPGARCYSDVRGLFGASAQQLHVAADRVVVLPAHETSDASPVLMALAATAWHALVLDGARPPELIVGNGVLGRLLARLSILRGNAPPTVWETNPARREGHFDFPVIDPVDDYARDYQSIVDVSGDSGLLDNLVRRLGRGGEIILAGFYAERISFDFAPAFMREVRFRTSAEWAPADIAEISKLMASGVLDLADMVSDVQPVNTAPDAYRTAFEDSRCLKMVLDWRAVH